MEKEKRSANMDRRMEKGKRKGEKKRNKDGMESGKKKNTHGNRPMPLTFHTPKPSASRLVST